MATMSLKFTSIGMKSIVIENIFRENGYEIISIKEGDLIND